LTELADRGTPHAFSGLSSTSEKNDLLRFVKVTLLFRRKKNEFLSATPLTSHSWSPVSVSWKKARTMSGCMVRNIPPAPLNNEIVTAGKHRISYNI